MTTAEILAAARAGKKPATPALRPTPIDPPETKPVALPPPAASAPVGPPSEAAPERPVPASIETILAEVRAGGEGGRDPAASRPPSVAAMLDAIRATAATTDRPPLIAGIIHEVRGRSAGNDRPPSVAGLLDQVRGRSAGGASASGTPPVEIARPTPAKPAVPRSAAGGATRSTEDILRLARAQGGKSGSPAASAASPREKAEPTPRKTAVGKAVARAAEAASADGRPRPPSVAEVLAAVRTAAQPPPIDYPSVPDMLRALRASDRSPRRDRPGRPPTLADRVRRWLAG